MKLNPLLLALLLVVAPALHGQDAKLSDTEQLRLDLHQTRILYEQALAQAGACRAQLREVQLTADEAALKATIEKAHGGYDFDAHTGQLTRRGGTDHGP